MTQLVSLWNKLPGCASGKAFRQPRDRDRKNMASDQTVPGATGTGTTGRSREEKESLSRSKSERIIALLQAPEGATLGTLMEATGWQAHSLRGFLWGTCFEASPPK